MAVCKTIGQKASRGIIVSQNSWSLHAPIPYSLVICIIHILSSLLSNFIYGSLKDPLKISTDSCHLLSWVHPGHVDSKATRPAARQAFSSWRCPPGLFPWIPWDTQYPKLISIRRLVARPQFKIRLVAHTLSLSPSRSILKETPVPQFKIRLLNTAYIVWESRGLNIV